MSVSHQFGGAWTQEKLDILERYLVTYATVMKRQYSFTTHYVDAFAGTGSRQSRARTRTGATLFEDEGDAQDADRYQRGSAQVALEIERPFDRYVFVDANPEFTADSQQAAA